MRPLFAPAALALALAACGSQQDAAEPPLAEDVPGETGAPAPAPSRSAARDYAPPTLTPEAARGEKGARSLLLSWAHAMEDRAFAEAYALFGEFAERTGMTSAEYVETFEPYETVTVEVGDGVIDGAAGSLYYGVPLALYGTGRNGSPYRREGIIVVRRVNDVPGATPAQLRWHLDRIEWSN